MPPLHNIFQRKSYALTAIERITQASYAELFTIWTGSTTLAAIAYWLLATYVPGHGPAQLEVIPDAVTRLLDSLYFSVITATSTGYGDILPQGISKLITSLQCIFSLLVFAVFVTKLVSRQQDAALQDVHRLAFEGIFYNIRHGLFIVRKDFDHLIHEAERSGGLNGRDWENLTSAYLQAQSLLEEIPDFYKAESNLYTIDKKREELLIEALQRTLGRIHHLLDVFMKHHIDWSAHAESAGQLASLVTIIDSAIATWEQSSPHHTIEHFGDILHLRDELRAILKQQRGHRH